MCHKTAESFSAADYLGWLNETHCSYRADLEEKLSALDTLKYTTECLRHVCTIWEREPSDHLTNFNNVMKMITSSWCRLILTVIFMYSIICLLSSHGCAKYACACQHARVVLYCMTLIANHFGAWVYVQFTLLVYYMYIIIFLAI